MSQRKLRHGLLVEVGQLLMGILAPQNKVWPPPTHPSRRHPSRRLCAPPVPYAENDPFWTEKVHGFPVRTPICHIVPISRNIPPPPHSSHTSWSLENGTICPFQAFFPLFYRQFAQFVSPASSMKPAVVLLGFKALFFVFVTRFDDPTRGRKRHINIWHINNPEGLRHTN